MAKSSRTAPPNSLVKENKEAEVVTSNKKGKETKVPPKADNKKGNAAKNKS